MRCAPLPAGIRDRRVYRITKAGEATFRDWIAQEPGDYIGRVPLLMTVWFGDNVPEEDFEWYLRVHYNKHRKKAEFYEGVYEAIPDKSTPVARALRFGLMFERTFVAWLDTLPIFGGTEEIRWPAPPRPEKPEAFEADEIEAIAGKMGKPEL